MALPAVIAHLKRYPGMFLSSVEFDGMTAFLNGYDIAQSGGFLVGFREWLIVQARTPTSRGFLAWLKAE